MNLKPVVTGAAMAVLAVGGTGALATAASAQPAPHQMAVVGAAGANVTFANTQGTVAGYLTDPATGVTSEKGGAVVPTVTCPATGTALLDQSVQIDGGTQTDLQGGGLFIVESCTSGVASYFAETFVGGTGELTSYSIAPGNKVGAVVTDTSSGSIKVESKNVTTGKVFVQSGTQLAGTVYYSWGIDQNSGTVSTDPIPTFSAPILIESIANGQPASAETPTAYDMYNGADLMISTGPLNGTGDQFSTTFVANS
jgi:Peptidase A4 family